MSFQGWWVGLGASARKQLFCKLKHRLVCRSLQMCCFVRWHFSFFCLYAAKIPLSFCRLFCLLTMNANVLQYETVGFSEPVLIQRWRKLKREPKPRKPLNPNCFILCVGRMCFIYFVFHTF